MKAYIYLLSRKQLGAGCPPQQGNLNSVITGRGLKTIRTRNVELNPLKWCDQIKRDKGMWWSIIKKQIMRWMLICSNVLCWLRALEHEALVFAVLSVGNDCQINPSIRIIWRNLKKNTYPGPHFGPEPEFPWPQHVPLLRGVCVCVCVCACMRIHICW